jgi:hypothetical protein
MDDDAVVIYPSLRTISEPVASRPRYSPVVMAVCWRTLMSSNGVTRPTACSIPVHTPAAAAEL